MKILIAGDLVPTTRNFDLFNNADLETLLGRELFDVWNSADARIFNLEVPLVDQEDPIPKCGPNLISPTSTVQGIKALNPSLLALANNHIMDQGSQGLESTCMALMENSIPFVGAGENLQEASKPYIMDLKGFRIGIYNCAEHEFSIASEQIPGANPFDPLESLDHISNLKDRCDYLIVLYHGGKEYFRYPSPYLQRVCRKMAKKGADLVVCQHSHCIGCFEEFQEATIVYGQANFIFDHSESEFWQTSLIIEIELGKDPALKYIPIAKQGNVIRLAQDKDAEEILSALIERSKEILQEGFMEKKYALFADENFNAYLRKLAGWGKWLGRIDRHIFKGGLLKMWYRKANMLAVQNCIECEAHRELLLKGIDGYFGSDDT